MPRAWARVMISSRLRRSASTGRPRRPSLAPSSTTRMRTSPLSDHSSRLSPPADVSPETPAFTTSKGCPSLASRAWISAGTDCGGSRPYPAVRLSPRNTIRGRLEAAGATAGGGRRLSRVVLAAAPALAGGAGAAGVLAGPAAGSRLHAPSNTAAASSAQPVLLMGPI